MLNYYDATIYHPPRHKANRVLLMPWQSIILDAFNATIRRRRKKFTVHSGLITIKSLKQDTWQKL